MAEADRASILVVGGGISGLTAAVEAAELGQSVHLIERSPYLGGRVAQNSRYFPKLCPPYCGLEINFRRIKQNRHVRFSTLSQVEKIEGERGDYLVTLRDKPRFITNKCTACGECVEACPVDRPNDFNYGLDTTKAIYLPHDMAFPLRYVIDTETCLGKACAKCVEACPYGAIELDMSGKTRQIRAGAIVWATGWNAFDASQISYYGFGRHANIINNVMMERMASVNGPSGGKIRRLTDGKEVQNVAFVQCAGSRDENHLPYCSGVCCLVTLKQTTYIREQYPEAKIYIFYIDIRAQGRLEDFYNRIKQDPNVSLIKGKVADIREDPGTRELLLRVEDVGQGQGIDVKADLVVLATGMVPSTAEEKIPADVAYDDYGFVLDSSGQRGIVAAGCVKKPVDVADSVKDATGAALRAVQSLLRR
jgi:quinone-modifying oxidoreductase subunit QmoA